MVVNFITSKIITVVFVTNAADHSPNARFYYNCTSLFMYPLIISLSKPSKIQTPYTPLTSYMNVYSHLVIWGNIFVLTLPIILSYIYWRSSD